jgi:endo-1,4-beta-xylanase
VSAGTLTRRSLLVGATQAAAASAAWGQSGAIGGLPLRRIAAMRGLLYGANIRAKTFTGDREYERVAARECGLFACSRAHWDDVSPAPGKVEYAEIDEDYAWAAGHLMEFRAHCLVWHTRVPDWFGRLDGRAAAVKALTEHVTETCRHFAGRVYAWDVVNEAIKPPDGRPDGLRNSVFIEKIGPEFLDIAFHVAHEGDPKTLLVYNEYDIELALDYHQARRQALLALLDGFKKRGTPIDAIGFQSHLRARLMPHFDDRVFSAFLDELAAHGLKVLISEMDVDDIGAPSGIAGRDAEVAAAYRRYLDVALSHQAVKAVITWGSTDRYVAIQDPKDPRPDGLPQRPLLFDADYRPKLAYFAVAEALAATPVR